MATIMSLQQADAANWKFKFACTGELVANLMRLRKSINDSSPAATADESGTEPQTPCWAPAPASHIHWHTQ